MNSFIKSLRENAVFLSNLWYRGLIISSCLGPIGLLETLAVRDHDVPGVGWGLGGTCRYCRRGLGRDM